MKEDGSPKLESLEFQINGVRPDRYMSTFQNTVKNGQLMKYYLGKNSKIGSCLT